MNSTGAKADNGRRETLLWRVKSHFLEMPGLVLTTAQAPPFLGLDRATCEALFGTLVDARFLIRTPAGAYVRYCAR